jgi:hypothetical protein
VLTGGARTGKTSVVRVFLEGLFGAEGSQPLLLTAPTGKARVRLETKTQRPASTVHQVHHAAGMLGADYRLLRKPTKSTMKYSMGIDVSDRCFSSVNLAMLEFFRALASTDEVVDELGFASERSFSAARAALPGAPLSRRRIRRRA